jgi:hypothetical protein
MTTAAVATSTDMTAATVTAATTAAMSTATATTVGAAAAMTATTMTAAATTMTSGKANRTFFVEDMESRQSNVGDFFFGHDAYATVTAVSYAMLDAAVLDLLEALQAAEICLRNRDRSELEVRVFMAVRAAIAKARAFHGET